MLILTYTFLIFSHTIQTKVSSLFWIRLDLLNNITNFLIQPNLKNSLMTSALANLIRDCSSSLTQSPISTSPWETLLPSTIAPITQLRWWVALVPHQPAWVSGTRLFSIVSTELSLTKWATLKCIWQLAPKLRTQLSGIATPISKGSAALTPVPFKISTLAQRILSQHWRAISSVTASASQDFSSTSSKSLMVLQPKIVSLVSRTLSRISQSQ